MTSSQSCCGCFSNIFGRLRTDRIRGRRYRRARYNEREYSIEFENLIEDEDFLPQSRRNSLGVSNSRLWLVLERVASACFVVSQEERDLVAKGRYDALIEHQKRTDSAIEEELRKQEEDLRLEEEAYNQAKTEAAKVTMQSNIKKVDKANIQSQRGFDSDDFSSWLSQENLESTTPELDVEDFDTFLEKVKARSLAGKSVQLSEEKNESELASWEATMNEGLEATKIADSALNALSPLDDEVTQQHSDALQTYPNVSKDDELLL